MLALQYRRSAPRFVLAKTLSKRFPAIATSFASSMSLVQTPEPKLPGPDWVRVRPLLSGICGSDIAILTASGTPYFDPTTSYPFVFGHEVIGEVVEPGAAPAFRPGQRVVIEPALGCRVRGIADQCAPCRSGLHAACENVTKGVISAGMQTGFCRDTGGGWSGSLVAHESQIHTIPDNVPNEAAVLTEPLSCAIHAALRVSVKEKGTVLVLGAGTVGLLTIAALRAFAPSCTVIAVAKYAHQQELAKSFGATHVIPPGEQAYQRLAELTGATLHKLPWGKRSVVGGVDHTFECSGSGGAWEDALRWTRAHGSVILVGMPGESRADLTPFWYKELHVTGAYAYGTERVDGLEKRTFQLALEMLSKQGWAGRVAALVRHQYPLQQYKAAIANAMHGGRSGAVKTVFDLTQSGAKGSAS